MPRSNRGKGGRGKAARREGPVPPAHPVFLEVDLTEWAGEPIAHSGRKYALLGRVETLRLSPDGKEVMARVRGNRPVPYSVRVVLGDNVPVGDCTCSQEAGRPCRHAVAALEALRFPLLSPEEESAQAKRKKHAGRRARGQGKVIQQAPSRPGFVILGNEERTLTKDERLRMAEKVEIQERNQRSRKEKATVKPLPPAGLPPAFLVGRRGSSGPYTVTLRGAKGDQGACTCPDFAKNELGTCKHIERARTWYSRKRKPPWDDVLSLWWKPRVWTRDRPEPLLEVRADRVDGELPPGIEKWFGLDGWILPPPEGRDGPGWVREAVASVTRSATEAGLKIDLDPAIRQQVALVESERACRNPLDEVHGEVWSGLEPTLGFNLHPYQVEGVHFLARVGRALLADDMGLGKTVQAVSAALILRRIAGAKKCLVVCPASLKHQWYGEILKVCGERSSVVEGRRSMRLTTYEDWREGFLIINYELVLRDLDLLRAAGADLVVLDEAQRIKNWDTKTAKAVKQLRSPYAFILTGTPLENRLSELHSLVEFLHPRALGPRWRLIPYHAVSDPSGQIVAYEDLDVLRGRLRPFFLRRERRMVLDQLPDRTENTFWTGMTPAQMRPYRRYSSRVARLLAKGGVLTPAEVRSLLQALTSMRILCNALAQHTWDRFESRVRNPDPEEPRDVSLLHSPKIEEFVNVMEEILEDSEAKVVVFSQWERMLLLARYALGDLLAYRGETTGIFHGGLDSRARTRLLDAFRSDPDFRILLSTDAGGLGLNLQDAASVVVNLEVPWNPAVLEQRVGRVHRMGQRESVQVLHFVTRDALEERVLRILEGKRALFEGLLVDEADRVEFAGDERASFIEQVRSLMVEQD